MAALRNGDAILQARSVLGFKIRDLACARWATVKNGDRMCPDWK
jgi:hypothetical protein